MSQLVTNTENFGDKAPIVEALIDLRAQTTVEPEQLRTLVHELKDEFPVLEEQSQWGIAFKIDSKDGSAATHTPVTPRGFLLRSADRTRVVQMRRDGFTMSHLRPYQDWDSLKGDAARLWQRFVDAARPQTVSRVAVRFINRLELPHSELLVHWLRLLPVVPEQLQLEPTAFALRTLHAHPLFPTAIAIVNLQQEQSQPPDPRVVVFDIDCFFPDLRLAPSDPAIWERLNDLRNFKNDIFFSSITEDTRSLLR